MLVGVLVDPHTGAHRDRDDTNNSHTHRLAFRKSASQLMFVNKSGLSIDFQITITSIACVICINLDIGIYL